MHPFPVIWNSAQFSGGGGGASFSFTTIQCDVGTSPIADSSSDTLTLTSSDSTITITGDSATDTINFAARVATLSQSGIVSIIGQQFLGTKTFQSASTSTDTIVAQGITSQVGDLIVAKQALSGFSGRPIVAKDSTNALLAGFNNVGQVFGKQGTAGAPTLCFTDGTNILNVSGIFQPAVNAVAISTGSGERLRVTSGGHVNIGGNYTNTSSMVFMEQQTTTEPVLTLRQKSAGTTNLLQALNSGSTIVSGINEACQIFSNAGSVSAVSYYFNHAGTHYGNTGLYSSSSGNFSAVTTGNEIARFNSGRSTCFGNDFTNSTAAVNMQTYSTTVPTLAIKKLASQTSTLLSYYNNSGTEIGYVNVETYHRMADGSAGAPTYSWLNSTTMGMYYENSTTIGFSTSGTKQLNLDGNGNIRAYNVHNNLTANGSNAEQDIRSYSFGAPTIQNEVNCTNTSFEGGVGYRIGNSVTIEYVGSTDISAGAADTSFEIRMPIATTFGNLYDAGGSGATFLSGNQGDPIYIEAVNGGDFAKCQWYHVGASGVHKISLTITFEVK